jgi:VWFA-related protein
VTAGRHHGVVRFGYFNLDKAGGVGLFVATLAFALVGLSGPGAGQDTTIRTTVPLVIVPASVTDGHGRSIDGLSADDFVVLDDGVRRKIRVDASDQMIAPLKMVVAIGASDVSRSALLKIRKVGIMIPEAVVGANGEGAVIQYDDEVRVTQDFTRNPDAIKQAFQAVKPSGSTDGRMLDAVDKALDMVNSRQGMPRAAILVIGESKDRGSKTKLDGVLDKLQRSGTTVYGLSYSAYVTPFTTKASEYDPANGGYPVDFLFAIKELARLAKRNTMEALVTTSGGRHLSFETKGKLENDLLALGKEVHSRYYISFTPAETNDPLFHRLKISIQGNTNAVVHARPGYWTGIAESNAPQSK